MLRTTLECCILFLVLNLSFGFSGTPKYDDHAEEGLVNLAFKMCEKISTISSTSTMHVVNFEINLSLTTLFRRLHDAAISTVLVDHQSDLKKFFSNHQSKSIMFFADSLGKIISFILDSASTENRMDKLSDETELQIGQNFTYTLNNTREFSNYCTELDTGDFKFEVKSNGPCDYSLLIASEELSDGSILPDHILAYTRGLYISKIFNHKNYILIMLTSTVKGWFQEIHTSIKFARHSSDRNLTNIDKKTPVDQYLNVTFQFFWRFFKGQKIAICCEDNCYWYDPFEKRVFIYPTESKRNLFSVQNQNTSVLKYFVDEDADTETKQVYEIFQWSIWLHLVIDLLGTENFWFPGAWYPILQDVVTFNIFQKYDINMYAATPGFRFEADDESNFDHTIAVDTCTVCLAAPRPGYMPQYLAPFKCFTLTVWLLIIMTIVALLLAQVLFQYSQRTAFRGLYSEQDASAFETTSAVLTVYAYFICGAPFRVLLGRFVTGRIIFLVLAFTVLIVSTVFQNGMVTLLSERVRYPDIDTVDELKESDILVQSHNVGTTAVFLDQYAEYGELSHKLIDSGKYYEALVEEGVNAEENRDYYNAYYDLTRGYNLTAFKDRASGERIREIMKSITLAAKTDSFIFSIPNFLISHQNFWVKPRGALTSVEYHHVQDCFLTYPMTFRILKNSIYFDALNRKLSQFVEGGQMKLFRSYTEEGLEKFSAPEESEELPRVFDMKDLQLAFIGLGLGLIIGCFVFIGELMADLLKK